MIEVFDLRMNRIGRILDTWDNKQTDVLNMAGEFEFFMAMESLKLDSMEFRPNQALSFLRHQTFIRWYEDGRYWFTGQPVQIEQREEQNGQLIAHVRAYGIMDYLSRFNVGIRSFRNRTVRSIIGELINLQEPRLVYLGEVEIDDELSIDFAYESLSEAIEALRRSVGGDIFIDPDTLSLNWVRRKGRVGPEIRYRKNMEFIRFLSDTTEHFTRIIPLGAGEAENRVTIAPVNDGVEYLQADDDTIEEFGIITHVWSDERFHNPDSLKRAAQRRLEEHKRPLVTFETSMLDLSQWQDEWGERPYRDRTPEVGDDMRIYHPRMGIDFRERLVKVERHWDEDKRHQIGIELNERKRTWADLAVGFQDRRSLVNQGYVFTNAREIFQQIDGSTTARMRFHLDQEIVRINYARLIRDGLETEGETGDPLSTTITITVNGTQIDSSNTKQKEFEIKDLLNIGEWNTILFSAGGPIIVSATLDIKSFFER